MAERRYCKNTVPGRQGRGKKYPGLGAVLVAFGISAGIGVLFGYLPAKKAARLNPIDALHFD